MPKFNIAQLLMGMALIAIGLVLMRSERLGDRHVLIESLSFSPDGSSLLVSKLTCRDARVPLKRYKTDVKRTLSILGKDGAISAHAILRKMQIAEGKYQTRAWQKGRQSVVNLPNGHVAVGSFNSTSLAIADSEKSNEVYLSELTHSTNSLAVSKSGRLVACGGGDCFTVVDTQKRITLLSGRMPNILFVWSPAIAFSEDESALFVADNYGVDRWDIANGERSRIPLQSIAQRGQQGNGEDSINAIATGPSNTLVVCASNWVRLYDLDGNIVSPLLPNGCSLCSSTSGGKELIFANYDFVYCVSLNDPTAHNKIPIDSISALAISPDGTKVAVGDYNGLVSLYDFETGVQKWKVQPPGSHGLTWPIPFACLLLWCMIAFWMFRRSNLKRGNCVTESCENNNHG